MNADVRFASHCVLLQSKVTITRIEMKVSRLTSLNAQSYVSCRPSHGNRSPYPLPDPRTPSRWLDLLLSRGFPRANLLCTDTVAKTKNRKHQTSRFVAIWKLPLAPAEALGALPLLSPAFSPVMLQPLRYRSSGLPEGREQTS